VLTTIRPWVPSGSEPRYPDEVSSRWRYALLLGLAPVLAACAVARPEGGPWQAPLGQDHPLAGRIWDVAGSRFIGSDALAARLVASRFVLLGEQHTNPDHHRLQAWAVRALTTAGRRPIVAFEMLTSAEAPALARHLAAAPRDAAGLGPAVGWNRSGWPDWKFYQPIAEAALDAGLTIRTANIPPTVARAVARGDTAALDPALVTRYGLDRTPPDDMAAMAAEIRESHCGQVPDRLVGGMVTAQRARDAQMAETLLSGGADGAVLIAGAGHVRTDRGVPAYIRRRLPAKTASLAFLEADPQQASPRAALPYDYVWYTPRMSDADPCVTFRRPLERLQQSN
jgi:uncharacterized iron-regulated protein